MRRLAWLFLRFAPFALLLAMFGAALNSSTGIPAWLRLERDYKETGLHIKQLSESLSNLERERDDLVSHEFGLEKLIRTELKFARPDELVIIFGSERGWRPSQ